MRPARGTLLRPALIPAPVIALTAALLLAPSAAPDTHVAREVAAAARGAHVLVAQWDRRKALWDGHWWQSARDLTALTGYLVRSDAAGAPVDPWLRSKIGQLAWSTFAANLAKRRGLFRDEFTDDTGWWGIAWLDAYTSREFPAHARQFLAAAEQDADYMHRLAWTRCGAGWHGLQWKRGTPPHMISEATYLELTAGLHNAIGARDTRYRGWSRQEWSWLQRSRFLTTYPDGITVLDQLDARCKPRTYLGAPMGARTYTQGELIRGLVESARDGARPAPLWAAANRLASWGLTHFSMPRDGDRILVEPCEASDSCYEHGERNIQAFKGVFIHGLRALVALEPSTPRTVALKQGAVRFLAAQAASLIASARADGRVGLHWFKRKRLVLADSTDQASAQEALNAALSWG